MVNLSKHFILSAFGTAGDTLPLIELGRLLIERGHEVDFLGLAYFEREAKAAGVPFFRIGPVGLFEEFANNSMAWHSYKGFGFLWRLIAQAIPDTLAHAQRLHRPGQSVLVGTSGALGLRLAQDLLSLRGATIHMAPFYLFSAVDNCFGGLGSWPDWWPLWFRRWVLAAIDHGLIDSAAKAEMNGLRASIGLPAIKKVFTRWSNSPDRVICAVPGWFASAQPDWPPQTLLTEFPMINRRNDWEPDAGLLEFLTAGLPPIVFSAASGVGVAASFYRRAVEVGRLLNRRVLLVSQFTAQIPNQLPDFAMHIGYAPFDQLLPKVAAIVHNGGIGTTALALRAGVAQVVVPFAYDQFYTAVCVERLGVGLQVPRGAPPEDLAAALHKVLSCENVRNNCARYRTLMSASKNGFEDMTQQVEALAATHCQTA